MGMQTIVEYANGMGASAQRPMIEMFAQSTDYFSAIPIAGMTGPIWEGTRSIELATPAFRGINEASSTGAGKVDPFQEASFLMDHDIDIDIGIIRRQGEQRRDQNRKMLLAAAGRTWATAFVAGENASDPREFDGLQVRCSRSVGSASRVTHNSSAAGGAALSLLKLDQAINAVNNPTHIIAPYDSRPLWAQAARTSTLTGFVMKDFTLADGSGKGVGAVPAMYNGLTFLWGYPKDRHTQPISFNEVGAGGGDAVTTSLYVASFGEMGLHGIQHTPLSIENVGLLEDRITLRDHLTWDVGLVDEHEFCMHRLDSWTNAAIVA
jgi:hypothetical protein